MMKRFAVVLLSTLMMAACQPSQDNRELPTLAAIPSATLTEAPTEVPTTPAPTLTPTLTKTPTLPPSETPIPSATPSYTPTITHTPSNTPPVTPTRNPTISANATATARIIEAPTLATLTPVPPGFDGLVRPTSTGTPLVAADVVITEPQFQEQLNLKLANSSGIEQTKVDFLEGGIDIEITAQGDGALVTGTVFISFTIEPVASYESVVRIQPGAIRMNGEAVPPEQFIEAAYGEAVPALVDAFDTILNNRLGAGNHNLENIAFTTDDMNVFLLVPAP
jgi:hypothetical protein